MCVHESHYFIARTLMNKLAELSLLWNIFRLNLGLFFSLSLLAIKRNTHWNNFHLVLAFFTPERKVFILVEYWTSKK